MEDLLCICSLINCFDVWMLLSFEKSMTSFFKVCTFPKKYLELKKNGNKNFKYLKG